tara:strand:- start:381 stop:779 length:399 start_codon:yes stop_codon:yes gene_type:complete
MSTGGDLIVYLLGSNVPVRNIVSNRISVGYREEIDVMPCIVVDIDSVDSEDSLTGTPSLDIVSVSIDCIHTSYADAVTLADAVLAVLGGASGTFETKTYSISANRSAASLTPSPDGGHVVIYPIVSNLYMEA